MTLNVYILFLILSAIQSALIITVTIIEGTRGQETQKNTEKNIAYTLFSKTNDVKMKIFRE